MAAVLVDADPSGVTTITLNRPESLNSLDRELLEALFAALDTVADSDARVVVLTGAGRMFCPGGSLKGGVAFSGFSDGGRLSLDAAARNLRFSVTVSQRLHSLPQVTLCAINGACAGAGMSIACACDLRVAAAGAKFGTAFLQVALSGDFGLSHFLPRIVGPAKARELFLLGAKLSAQEALSAGLVSEVLPDAQALARRAAEIAGQLAAAAPLALRHIKANLAESERLSLTEALDAECRRHAECGAHPDAEEAARAFLDKRPPRFGGEGARARL